MARLTKYEKETIILTSEGDDTHDVYTFNFALKRRLAHFARKYPECCCLESEDRKLGCQSYVIKKRQTVTPSECALSGRQAQSCQ